MAAAQNIDGTLCLTLVTDGSLSTVIQSFSMLVCLQRTYRFYVKLCIR
jgi:hypothetical protein